MEGKRKKEEGRRGLERWERGGSWLCLWKKEGKKLRQASVSWGRRGWERKKKKKKPPKYVYLLPFFEEKRNGTEYGGGEKREGGREGE